MENVDLTIFYNFYVYRNWSLVQILEKNRVKDEQLQVPDWSIVSVEKHRVQSLINAKKLWELAQVPNTKLVTNGPLYNFCIGKILSVV